MNVACSGGPRAAIEATDAYRTEQLLLDKSQVFKHREIDQNKQQNRGQEHDQNIDPFFAFFSYASPSPQSRFFFFISP